MKKFGKLFAILLIFAIFSSIAFTFTACGEPPVYYSDFGAVGDGKTDDFEAICAAHEYANENGKSVKADDGAHYYVGAHTKTAVIMTDTDWGNAQFTIDDSEVTTKDRGWYVFEVRSESEPYNVDIPEGYSLIEGQVNVEMQFDTDVMLRIVNKNKKDYIRYGKNTNSGSDRQEMILVDKKGNVDENTPILWDYDEVTSITAYSVSDKALTVKGGSFTTIANRAPISANYYARGINVKRSNTTLDGIKHYVTGEGEVGSPYTGFFVVNNANHVTIKNCVMTGRHTYTNIKETGAVSQGSYDTQAVRCNDVAWINCTQTNQTTDTTYWGVMASNFCKNLKMDGCNLSRFDAHQGVFNATITNTVLGQTLNVIGAGTLRIENVQRLSGSHFLQLRTDYGSTWEGEVILKDCKLTTTGKSCYAIQAEWNNWDFGYRCYLPRKVTLDNFEVEYSGNGNPSFYVFSSVTNTAPAVVSTSKNPYVITEEIIIKNEKTTVNVSPNGSGLFNGVVVDRIDSAI